MDNGAYRMIEEYRRACKRREVECWVFSTVMYVVVFGIFISLLLFFFGGCTPAWAEVTEASYFTRASCIKESGQCTMANGKELVDEGQYLAASWDYPLNSKIKVSHAGKSIIATVSDRGPNKKLYRSGRKLDLNLFSFKALASPKLGVITVEVEKI